MISRYFVKQGIKESQIEDFIRKTFPMGDYSRTELQRTPLGIKIIIYTNKPGRIIGRGGKNINDMTEAVKAHFDLENPQIDVKVIEKPDLDPKIVAKQITSALERGYNYKKIGNLSLKRIMDSGALGAEIIIAGKLGGSKGMIGKFTDGHLKHCGHPAKTLVDEGFEEANTRPGKIGVKVKIMKKFMSVTGELTDRIESKKVDKKEEPSEEKLIEEKLEEKKSAEKKQKKKPAKKTKKAIKKPSKRKAPEKKSK